MEEEIRTLVDNASRAVVTLHEKIGSIAAQLAAAEEVLKTHQQQPMTESISERSRRSIERSRKNSARVFVDHMTSLRRKRELAVEELKRAMAWEKIVAIVAKILVPPPHAKGTAISKEETINEGTECEAFFETVFSASAPDPRAGEAVTSTLRLRHAEECEIVATFIAPREAESLVDRSRWTVQKARISLQNTPEESVECIYPADRVSEIMFPALAQSPEALYSIEIQGKPFYAYVVALDALYFRRAQ